jgi:hypothetical protein
MTTPERDAVTRAREAVHSFRYKANDVMFHVAMNAYRAAIRDALLAEVVAAVEGVTRFRSCPCGRDTLTAIRALTEAR